MYVLPPSEWLNLKGFLVFRLHRLMILKTRVSRFGSRFLFVKTLAYPQIWQNLLVLEILITYKKVSNLNTMIYTNYSVIK